MWHFLRGAGYQPPDDQAKRVLGVVMEMPVGGAHDLLAAYEDGSARYLDYSGKVVILEDRTLHQVQEAIKNWLSLGQVIVQAIGPWTQPALPALPANHLRVMMLTPSGPHFGQGPSEELLKDKAVAQFCGLAQLVLTPLLNPAPS
jgi:hypothetical protein